MPIGKIRHKGLRKLYQEDDRSGLLAAHVPKIRRILTALDSASSIADMKRFPGWDVHPLKGDRRGEWGITVTGNWRIVFRRDGDEFTDVNYEDYH